MKEIAKNLENITQINGFGTWYKQASPKEQKMAQRISDAILVDFFAKKGKSRRLSHNQGGLINEVIGIISSSLG